MTRRLLITALVTVIGSMTAATQPQVEHVTPPQGFVDAETRITLAGHGFGERTRVALLAGGPRLVANAPFGQMALDVAVSGSIACVAGAERGLVVFDIGDPEQPVIRGAVDTPDTAWGVAVAGRYAFVADGEDGLIVIDVSDPAAPVLIGAADTPGYASAVAVSGTVAVVADWHEGLQVIDVSDPSAPRLVGAIDTPGYASHVVLQGRHAFVADGDEGIVVVDIAEPAMPVIVGRVDTPGSARAVATLDRWLLVADWTAGVQVVDIADPVRPLLVSSVETPDLAGRIAVDGDLAFVADWLTGVLVLDLENPARPVVIGHAGTVGAAAAVAISGGFCLVADYWSGLSVVDARVPTSPPPLGELVTGGAAGSVAVSGANVLLADRDAGLLIATLSDPTAPRILSSVGPPGPVDVAVAGDSAFTVDSAGELQIFDIRDPDAPESVSRLLVGNYTSGVAVAGRVACVSGLRDDGSGFLVVVDVGDPATPVVLGHLVLPGRARDVALTGNLALVAVDEQWLVVVDLTNPARPVILSQVAVGSFAASVAAVGERAYVAAAGGGLVVVDISDPQRPAVVQSVPTPGYALAVAVLGTRIAVGCCWPGEVFVFDTSTPASVTLAGSFAPVGCPGGVALAGDLVLVAEQSFGLGVFRLNPPLEDLGWLSSDAMEVTIPPGFVAGPYDVAAGEPPSGLACLPNAYRACEHRRLDARLVPPATEPSAGELLAGPIRWWIDVNGDAALFRRGRGPAEALLLPALPESLERVYLPGTADGRSVIELRLDSARGTGRVVLVGDDPQALSARWERARRDGGFLVPPRQEGGFGDLALALRAAPHGRALQVFRYAFSGEKLVEATAAGRETDLEFETRGVDLRGCETVRTVSLAAAQREACRRLQRAHPELRLDCEQATLAAAAPVESLQ